MYRLGVLLLGLACACSSKSRSHYFSVDGDAGSDGGMVLADAEPQDAGDAGDVGPKSVGGATSTATATVTGSGIAASSESTASSSGGSTSSDGASAVTGAAAGTGATEPCPDSDLDGVCDVADRCALGDDSLDADQDGIPDACDGVDNSDAGSDAEPPEPEIPAACVGCGDGTTYPDAYWCYYHPTDFPEGLCSQCPDGWLDCDGTAAEFEGWEGGAVGCETWADNVHRCEDL